MCVYGNYCYYFHDDFDARIKFMCTFFIILESIFPNNRKTKSCICEEEIYSSKNNTFSGTATLYLSYMIDV